MPGPVLDNLVPQGTKQQQVFDLDGLPYVGHHCLLHHFDTFWRWEKSIFIGTRAIMKGAHNLLAGSHFWWCEYLQIFTTMLHSYSGQVLFENRDFKF